METFDGIIDGGWIYLSRCRGPGPVGIRWWYGDREKRKTRRVRVSFSRGAWARETLKGRTEQFEGIGFDCYLQGAHGSCGALDGRVLRRGVRGEALGERRLRK